MNSLHQYKDLPVLITGGCGFIGSQLALRLARAGARITIVDNLSHGTRRAIESIESNVHFIHGDIRDSNICLQATEDQAIIFHCAAFISAPDSCARPFECLDVNVQGTLQLLEAARIQHVHHMVFSSSAAVYGPYQMPVDESFTCHPTSPYGYSKVMGELLCKQYAQLYAMHIIMLRYFNVWGEQQNPHSPYAGVIARFLHNFRHNIPITIHGDGSQTRDFVHVDQIVDANLKAPFWTDHWSGQTFNIASGASVSLLTMAQQLRSQFPDYTHPFQFTEKRAGDIDHSRANCQKYFTVASKAEPTTKNHG